MRLEHNLSFRVNVYMALLVYVIHPVYWKRLTLEAHIVEVSGAL